MRKYEILLSLIEQGELKKADAEISQSSVAAELTECERLYLQGLIFAKQSDWSGAKSCFLQAVALDKNSPAVGALKMVSDIYDYYYKDNLNP